MPEIAFNRFYRYAELTDLLVEFGEEYPQILHLESIGKSYEGRDIWVMTVTNKATGDGLDKPAIWIDGNIHATEVSPSTACLYFLNQLVTRYGDDPKVTRIIDTKTIYICPRVNPDGAEWALADKPKFIRSSTRPYPYDEEALEGLDVEDMDGDGRVLTMRVKDPNGMWKPHPKYPRLMVRREPDEFEGDFYFVFPEGKLRNYDGYTIKFKRNKEGLDLNRNFPMEWRQEYQQMGAGPYPTSEPEVKALVDFISKHNNIASGTSFHTFGGVILRPSASKPDSELPVEDLEVYKKVGQKGSEVTGYPNVSIFHDFKYHPQQVISGGFDWTYDQRGMYMFGVEIWSPQRQSGIESYDFIKWYDEHPLEDDLKMLAWSDTHLEGKGYIDWYEFEHPQLGKVELGGWDTHYAWRNPPPKYLEYEVAKFTDWLLFQANITPQLNLLDATVTPLDIDTYVVTLAVQNTGWLPTYVSKQALKQKAVRGVIAEITLPEGATLQTGKSRADIGQLEGRNNTPSALSNMWTSMPTADRVKAEWVVNAPQGGTLSVTVKHDRAGKITREFELGG